MADNMFEFSSADAADNMETLGANPYPGRGIIIGKSEDGQCALQVYWVMGRSENSRNRMLIEESGVVKTVPHEASKVEDPSLIIYNAMRQSGRHHIVSNGDQTDTVVAYLEQSKTFKAALITRTYEPDSPNYTPRITAMISMDSPEVPFTICIITKSSGSDRPIHRFYRDSVDGALAPGTGLCLHTYQADNNPLPSFDGDPYGVLLGEDRSDTAAMYWDLLNTENRVALAVKQIDIGSGVIAYTIINQLPDNKAIQVNQSVT